VGDRHERVEAERLVRAQDAEAGRAGAMADDQPLAGRDRPRRGADLGVGHAQQHDVGAGAVRTAPERAQDATAGRVKRSGKGPAQTAAADDRDRALHLSRSSPRIRGAGRADVPEA